MSVKDRSEQCHHLNKNVIVVGGSCGPRGSCLLLARKQLEVLLRLSELAGLDGLQQRAVGGGGGGVGRRCSSCSSSPGCSGSGSGCRCGVRPPVF